MQARSTEGGFTLIELLVVIAIIGLLASIILASLNNARIKARDAKRIADLRDFQLALELYYSTNNHYPYTGPVAGGWTSFDSPIYSPNRIYSGPNGSGSALGTLTQAMAPDIGQLSDPYSLGADSGYLYNNQGGPNDYCILFWRTPENLNDFPKSDVPTTRCTAWNSAGQCTSGTNAIYSGTGIYAAGC
jgi:prepilin-type N-terminal cleavage/methylation domain-containing protein